MARLSGFEPQQRVCSDIRDMESMQVWTWQDIYKEFGLGLAVNDGKYLTKIDDREELNEI